MSPQHRWTKLAVVFGALVWVAWARAYSFGPPPGFTGAPGEDTCAQCHDDVGPNSGNGSVSFAGLPSVYQPGQRYTVEVRVQQAGQFRWGFEATALTLDGAPAGTLIADGSLTQLVFGPPERTYIQHTFESTNPGTLQGTSWRFDWIAPAEDLGPITFYASGNAANNDGDRTGDFIYTTSQTVSPPSLPEVSLVAPNGGETLGTDEVFRIRWEASGNATGFSLLLSEGEGTLPSSIVAGLPSFARSFDWRVPSNLIAGNARVMVVAFNSAGSNADDSDQTFSVVDRTPPQVLLVTPQDGSVAAAGGRMRIQWIASDNVGLATQDVGLSTDDGISFTPLAEGLGAAVRSFDWKTPSALITTRAKIRVTIRDRAGNTASAANAKSFTLKRLVYKIGLNEPALPL